jgi:ubiquinone/menaquinone biosynthesis C-methylase UbiE
MMPAAGEGRQNMTNELTRQEVEAEAARITDVYSKRVEGTRYSWFTPGHLFMMQELERQALTMLGRHGYANVLNNKRALEVGCGKGTWLRKLIQWGVAPENLTGVDLLADHLAEARRLCPAGTRIEQGSATNLEFADASFDLVLQITVFTSVREPKVKEQIAREMLRVVKPDGLILWLDFLVNNPRNPDVRGIGKKEVHQLFPGCQIELRRVLLAPPILRAVAPHSWIVCHLLGLVPWLRTHCVGAIRKRGPGGRPEGSFEEEAR